ncbi:MAG: DNA polymerase III subunit beta [Rickettsiales bacterium]|nr:DNA polymerase III subunit beta [Rickettsiales bacterium]
MQFKVKSNIFLKALSVVNGVVEKRNTIPVLQNIKITAKNNNINLCASDMDLYASSNIDCEITQEGCTTVPSQMLFDIVRKINDNSQIEIKLENENNIKINCQNSKYNLPCINASEFPDIDNNDYENSIEIEGAEFAKMIDKTKFAISNDETRYYLNGLYLHNSNKNNKTNICSVATDGHRLALSNIEYNNINDFGIIIPKKSVSEIRRIIDPNAKITIKFSRVKIEISSNQNKLISKLIDGQFPDYNKILPQNNQKIAIINKREFYNSIDRVSSVANDKHKSIKLTVENNKIDLEVSTNDGSFAHEVLDIKYNGEKIITGFNSRYLMDIIAQIDHESLTMKFDNNMSPTLIESDNINCQFVIMPIRVN